jgi:CARDB
MVRRHASVSAILMGLCLLGASPVLAQSTVQQVPQRQVEPIIPPEWKPDLVVTSAKVTTVCTAQGTATAKIVATIKNQSPKGTADLSKAVWQIIVEVTSWWSTGVTGVGLENPGKQTVKPQIGGPKTLKPGQSWTGTLTIVGIPKFEKGGTKPGQYGFEVRADPQKAVAESNEANNELLTYAFDPCFKP